MSSHAWLFRSGQRRRIRLAAALLLAALLAFIGASLNAPSSHAQVMVPPGPVIAFAVAQPTIANEITFIASPPSDWVDSYFANDYQFELTTNPSGSQTADGTSIDPMSSGPNPPLGNDWKFTLNFTGISTSTDVYVMARADLQSGLTSSWSVSEAPVWGPHAAKPPAPSPTPDPTPTAPPTPSPTPTPTTTPVVCPAVQFIGVRGSGETRQNAGGYGNTVARVLKIVKSHVHGLSSTPIDYPAISVDLADPAYRIKYLSSEQSGVIALDKFMYPIILACPQTKIILVGYSQGAQVAGDEFDTLLSPDDRQHIAALILIGDPRFNGKQTGGVNQGSFSPKLNGIFQLLNPHMRIIAPANTAQVRSYCVSGDPVCNYSPLNALICFREEAACPHLEYDHQTGTTLLAKWAVNRVG